MQKTLIDPSEPIDLGEDFNGALKKLLRVNTKEKVEVAEKGKACPFVKWVGGKRSILHEILPRVPQEFGDYYEPFVGGGALFFELCPRIKRAYLSDTNIDLVLAYNVIKKDPELLIDLLKRHAKCHAKQAKDEYYYKVREQHELQDPIRIAARLLYLNRTCYNGLFRTNREGRFNVPMGRYKNPNIIQEDNIMLCHRALQKAVIEIKDFTAIEPKKGDFVYFDPPYHPTDETSFTQYTKSDFTEKDQERLRDFALKLHKAGVKVMISNSRTRFIENLYANKIFKIGIVDAPRVVNCKADRRKMTKEVLITNY